MASTTAASKVITKLPSQSSIAWALSGWTFFIAENAILSENRTFLIDYLGGDDPYHWLYGTCSTAAMGSIGYSYYILVRQTKLNQVTHALPRSLWRIAPIIAASWTSLTVGFILALQGLPNMQVPISPKTLQVRCPFDFTPRQASDSALFGVERITRHPGLWSMGLVGIGNALLHAPHSPLRYWWTGPALVAWLGGAHTDSRYRRGLGGQLDAEYDSITSNVPLAATLTQQQGHVLEALGKIIQELKPLNAGLGALLATAWVVTRGRVRMSL